MTAARVLVTGATGLLGPYLAEAAAALGPVVTSGRRGGERPCDLTDGEAVAGLVKEVGPGVVLHAAAMTDVDGCQADPEMADRVNRGAVETLARCLAPAARLIMISTDQVYPDTPGPHGEGEAAPVNAYGRSKLAGERAALERNNTLVARTNLFGPSRTPARASLSDFVAERLAAGEPLTLFEDVLFSPLHMATLGALTVECAEAGLTGIFNLASREGMSKLHFGLAVAKRLGLSTASARAGLAADIGKRAPRPSDLRMDVTRIEEALGRPMPTLAEEIERL